MGDKRTFYDTHNYIINIQCHFEVITYRKVDIHGILINLVL